MSLFLIAEIGINHNGNLAIAKRVVDWGDGPEGSQAGGTAVGKNPRVEVVSSG